MDRNNFLRQVFPGRQIFFWRRLEQRITFPRLPFHLPLPPKGLEKRLHLLPKTKWKGVTAHKIKEIDIQLICSGTRIRTRSADWLRKMGWWVFWVLQLWHTCSITSCLEAQDLKLASRIQPVALVWMSLVVKTCVYLYTLISKVSSFVFCLKAVGNPVLSSHPCLTTQITII